MPDRISVTAAEFARNFGYWQEQAITHPVSITRHGRERLVLSSAERFAHAEQAKDPLIDANAAALKSVLSNMAEGFIAFDAGWRIVRVNRLTESYFGLSSAEILGRRADEIIRGLNGSFLFEQFNRVGRTREPATFETESIAFPGRFLEFHAFPYLDGVATLWINKTEERHLRQSVAHANATVSAARAHPAIATACIDPRGRFTCICDTFLEWAGFASEQLIGAISTNIIAPADRARLMAAFNAVLQGGGAQMVPATVIARDGAECPLDMALSATDASLNEPGVCIVATRKAESRRNSRPKAEGILRTAEAS